MEGSAKRFTIAVVIPAYNASDTVLKCLQSLLSQTRRPDEIVCVDNNSKDRTHEVIASFGAENPSLNIKLLREPVQGSAAARNCGWRAAHSDLIAFIDADAYAREDWLEAIERLFAEEGWDGIGGMSPMHEPATLPEKVQAIEFVQPAHYYGKMVTSRGAVLCGEILVTCNATYKRSVLEKIGGFDATLTIVCEDSDVTVRAFDAGAKLAIFHPDVFVWHVMHRSYWQFLRRIFEYRISLAPFVKRDYKKRAIIQSPVSGIYEFPFFISFTWTNESYFVFTLFGGAVLSWVWRPFALIYAAAMLYLGVRLILSYRSRLKRGGIPYAAPDLAAILVLDAIKKIVAVYGRVYGSIRERVFVL